ncbi:MAG: hypothetical protein IT210_14425 [Armatimonadetes bacterium]|nr:hypothetical protein [Armatimonadota bacterium]
MIALTKQAADMVKSVVPADPDRPACLRLWATEERDGSLQLHMKLEYGIREGDQVMEVEEIYVAVEPAAAQVLNGSLIDYDDEEDGGSFRVCPLGEVQPPAPGA